MAKISWEVGKTLCTFRNGKGSVCDFILQTTNGSVCFKFGERINRTNIWGTPKRCKACIKKFGK